HGGPLDGTQLRTVDPGGIIARHIEARRVVGCIVYPATSIVAPGVIQHVEGNRFSLGELDGVATDRTRAIAAALIKGGLKAPIRPRIRDEIWLKLLGNVCFNPISALTRATMVQIATDPEMRHVARALMEEADSVARALGIELVIGVDQRLAGAEKVGAHKTSMLQDVEAGRPLEIEPLLGAVLEIAALLGLALPTCEPSTPAPASSTRACGGSDSLHHLTVGAPSRRGRSAVSNPSSKRNGHTW